MKFLKKRSPEKRKKWYLAFINLYKFKYENRFKNYFKYILTLIAFLILVVAEILVKYSGKSFNNSLIYYFTPIILMPLIYLEIIRNFLYENLRKK